MASLKMFKTDASLEEKGVPVMIAAGVTVNIRSATSRKVREWEIARYKKHRALYAGGGGLTVDQMDKDEIDKCAEVLVTGWDGLTQDDDVTPIAFSIEAARQVFTEAPAFRRAVVAASVELENFRKTEAEAAAKNSEMPSKQDGGTGASQS